MAAVFQEFCPAAFDEGRKRAQVNGIKISRADITFPDRDPAKDRVKKR